MASLEAVEGVFARLVWFTRRTQATSGIDTGLFYIVEYCVRFDAELIDM